MIIVSNESDLISAISNLETEIVVADNINLTSPVNIGHTVSISGERPGLSLFWANPTAANNSMFVVTSSGKFTLSAITLDAEYRNGTLVTVNGGLFTMNEDATLQNIRTTTAQVAVKIGDLSTPIGGVFMMNAGLITGVESGDSAVFCSGGTVVMNNYAEISGNINSGITLTDTITGGVRSTLTMLGRSRISNNRCTLAGGSGGAGRILGSDVIMGGSEGDAPIVTGNESVGTCGGFIFSTGTNTINRSRLIMRYGAEISGNSASSLAGAVGGVSFDVFMSENAAIKNNNGGDNIGGLMLSTGSTAVLDGSAEITGNTSAGLSGGIYLNNAADLQMKGNSSVHGNSAAYGAGIYLANTVTASIGLDDTSPRIYNNQAASNGGGVFLAEGGTLNLTGQSNIADNTASEGKGIYKAGVLNLSGSPQILDGLFFDDLSLTTANTGGDTTHAPDTQVRFDSEGRLVMPALTISDTATPTAVQTQATQPAYSANVPVIADALTSRARIQLERSGYVSQPNVQLVIADKGAGYAQLLENDRAAWKIPVDFGEWYAVILNDASDQVLIALETYRLVYNGTYGAAHTNPVSYDVSALPITLTAPGSRPGYAFTGWLDSSGKRVTEIPAGTMGHIALIAGWEPLRLSFDGGASDVCNVPQAIPVTQRQSLVLPDDVPCRPCHRFICWRTNDGDGKVFFPGDTFIIAENGVTLYAKWQEVCCSCHNHM